MAVPVFLINSSCWLEHMLLWILKQHTCKVCLNTKVRKQCDFLFSNRITFFISFVPLMCAQFHIGIIE